MSIYNALSKAEGIKSTIQKNFRDNLASFIFKYIGDSNTLIKYLTEHIKSDIKLGRLRPTLTNSNDNSITFKYK